MLTIHDEELVRQLEAMAAEQQRPVEEVLKSILTPYKKTEAPSGEAEIERRTRRLKQTMYSRARQFWRENNNAERANLSDEELSERFWGFDVKGVPYLHRDIDVTNPPQNPLLNMALSGQHRDLVFSETGVARRSREILDSHFADYILKRSKRLNDEN